MEMNKQISLTMPEALFKESRKYSKKMGYLSTQEFILDLLRRKLLMDEEERLLEIERKMDEDPNTLTFKSKEEFLEHLNNL
jgi:metal-responsive CopG/Arc/MetJ family transcriptional regulator